jgi:MtfA peptidase
MNPLRGRWRSWRDQRAARRRAIPDALWQTTLERYPFLAWRTQADLDELRRLASIFLDRKEFHGADGFEVTDDVAVAVAAQACLPVLRLGLEPYDAFVGIVMHADEVVAQREVQDEDGLVHTYDEVIAGEAMEGGPLMLSWADASGQAESDWGYSVVIHEFAHVLDMANGDADGVPHLANADAHRAWVKVLQVEFDAFQERVVCGHDTVIDPYGAQAMDEFFAVASEAFFVTPKALSEEHEPLYRMLERYYGQDPAAFEARATEGQATGSA